MQLAAALTIVAWAALASHDSQPPVPRTAIVLAALLLLPACLQLVPLPPAVWQRLPGRELEAAALRLVGSDARWMPWSVSPTRTLASLLSLVPPAVALCLASVLDRRGRIALLATVSVMGLLSLLLGALQLADGAGRTWRFYLDNPGFLNGFQASRNAQADVMLLAAVATSAAAAGARSRIGSRPAGLLAGGCAAALLLGCTLTGSRAGILLIPVAGVAALLPWLPRGAGKAFRAIGLAALGAVLAGAVLLSASGAIRNVAARFTPERDLRLELWRDTATAIATWWPFGSGIGTFRLVFVAAERLEAVDPTLPVRAHNDYLELALEAGIFGLLWLGLGIAVLAWVATRAVRRARRADAPPVAFALAALIVVALHSLVDYPLRSMALTHLTAIAAGMLVSIASGSRVSRPRELATA